MEIGNSSKWVSIIEDHDEGNQVKQEPPVSVWLRSNYPDRLIVIGSVSGERYEFPRGDSVLQVDERDVPEMLTKYFGGNSCCGSNVRPLPKFAIVE